ncbi:MAG: hypothetical protein KTR15_15985 [Phycisphaeraceae bacterium]|nr:hypothetical protein [Phycisphaeraceae bacterium]
MAGATPTGITCPDCGTGKIVPTRGRFGLMYACEHRPKACSFWMNKRPTGQTCDYRKTKRSKPCGKLMMQGTKTIPDRCSDKACPNHHPHKLATG